MSSVSRDFLSSANPHDEYELIQRIGSGTYGDVYKVILNRLKISFVNRTTRLDIFRRLRCALSKWLNSNPAMISISSNKKFSWWFNVLTRISSPISEVISSKSLINRTLSTRFVVRRDKLWIAMELCAGGSMQDIYHGESDSNDRPILNASL
jgi:serine/threonine protein kinase